VNARQTAAKIRKLAGNTLFSVKFIKRSDGELREMVCRLGATKGVKGTGGSYDPASKGLLTVFDVQKDGWRSIPLDAIQQVRIRGKVYLDLTAKLRKEMGR
jgi:hypothetical protein